MRQPIKNYEGLYEIDESAAVHSLHRHSRGCVKTHTAKNGYVRVRLNKNGVGKTFLLHRLVAVAFIRNPDALPEVNHLNGNKGDNRAENLEWVTHRQNRQHARSLPTHTLGERNGQAKLTWPKVREIRQRVALGATQVATAAEYGVAFGTVSEICRGNIWKRDPDNERCDQLAAALVVQ